ncbi:DUF3618 domain-containing protein [Saccharothrix sp. AJ9571]|nr:DUF3618 domain-containing protein [Saccharothrix sp. AJ9571]
MTEPDRIRHDIENTQQNLSRDVDALTEKVTPGRIVERRVGRLRDAVTATKDKVMGTAESGTRAMGDKLENAGDKTGAVASSAVSAVSQAPEAVRRETQGNPLAAGLIAFGAGWLAASLLPASKREIEAAGQAVDFAREHVQPVAQQVAEQAKDQLSEPAKQAAESVKSAASEAASNVSGEARSAAEDVTGRAQEAKEKVQPQS